MRSALSIVLMPLMMLVACGGGDEAANDENTGEQIASRIMEESGIEPSTDTTPCDVLDDELIRAHFTVTEGAEISRKPSKYSPYPLCTVSWRKANADEIEAQSGAAMSDYLQRKMRGEDVKMPIARTNNEVSLTIVDSDFASADDARRTFEASMKMLSDGITRSHEGTEVTIQADLTPVDGVGDKALWAPTMRQLSVVDGTTIFHVTVNTGDLEADLATAQAIASDVSRRI